MKKRQEIEILRILSAFGIVWYHTAIIGRDVAYSGLIAFLIISMYFSAKSGATHKTPLERARSLLVPWGAWFVFYGILNLVNKKSFFPMENGVVAGFLSGTSIHLWYMPFIFMAIVVFDRIKVYVGNETLSYACIFIAICILLLSQFWRSQSISLGYPYAQYAHALDGVLIGVFFANCSALPRTLRAGFILLILAFVLIFTFTLPGVGVPYFLGILVAAFTLLPKWEFNFDARINCLSECTLGIYLSHIFWLKVIKKIDIVSDFTLPFMVFLVSALTVWCFKKMAPRLSSYTV